MRGTTIARARRIPVLIQVAGLALLLFQPRGPELFGQAAAPPDTGEVIEKARRAEREFEAILRRRAPLRAGRSGSECDERVGRFCLFYDVGRSPIPPEPPVITEARRKAIERLENAFRVVPGERRVVFPLIRFLIEAERAADAVTIARAFREARPGGDALMVLGLALHAAGETVEAERVFRDWLQILPKSDREREGITNLSVLLDRRERGRYKRLQGEARAQYEERVWRYADPLYLTRGNESWTEHMARHGYARMLPEVPWVAGSTGWGSDVEELTIRFGVPKTRSRSFPTGFVSMGGSDLDIMEYYDPEQMIYVPPALDSALAIRSRPGMGWPLDTVRSTSGYAPPTIRRMTALEHQVSLFPTTAGWILSVHGVLSADSVARDSVSTTLSGNGALFVLDSALRVLRQHAATITAYNDSVFFAAETLLPANSFFYSAELLETDTRLAGRARFRLDLRRNEGDLRLSDVLIADAYEPGALPSSRGDSLLEPLPSLLIGTSEVGIYAEVLHSASVAADSIAQLTVELEVRGLDGPALPVRVVNWIGQRLGLSSPRSPTRLGWSAEVPAGRPYALPVTLDLSAYKPGRYAIELTVIDPSTGARVAANREILLKPPD